MSRKRSDHGFTLVEILIVVVILGILAAIVIPQFTSASETAKGSSLVTQLQSIRSQLELYQLQHNGEYPTAANMAGFGALITPTLVDGTLTPGGGANTFGPYMQKAPVNPFTAGGNGNLLAANDDDPPVLPNAAAGVGWVYNSTSGEIRASLQVDKATEVDINTDAVDGDASTYN